MPPFLIRPPRVYRPDLTMKVLFAVSGFTLIAFGGVFTYLFGRLFKLFFIANGSALHTDSGTRIMMVLVTAGGGLAVLLCAIGGLTQLLKLAKFAVILSADSIRFQAPFGSTTLAFDQILCKRSRVPTGRFGRAYTVLIPRDQSRRTLAISADFVFDEAYARWLASLPEFDASFVAAPAGQAG